ncbi:MAG: Asp-tRNA(Asn)/Glu-tRNA(Gln) amidotransferase subunit GatC [Kiritimatiellae bacterium]|nr:Asp-tRNA(Asn)/Glu-tRNA(Gln) amidotransferase subunit GatC [Kiritimatiellia bacterium]
MTTDSAHIDVPYVAHLARLDLTPEETRTFERQLNNVVNYVAQLQALDTTGVEPTAHATPVYNRLRDDEPRDGLSREDALANAPAARNGLYIVPKIME